MINLADHAAKWKLFVDRIKEETDDVESAQALLDTANGRLCDKREEAAQDIFGVSWWKLEEWLESMG
jgi:hypothetical protein